MTLALVTGAAGAIGGPVVRQLAARGDAVIGIGHGARPQALPLAGWINGEIISSNLNVLAAAHGTPALILHLAGGSSVTPSLAAPAEDFSRTVTATVNLLDWARQHAASAAIVLASSAAVYGAAASLPVAENAVRAPVSPYGVHKAMMEMAAGNYGANFGMRLVSVRLFSVYGPGLRKQLVWEVLNRLKQGERRLMLGGTGGETRDWLHIEDAARLLIAAAAQTSNKAPCLNGCTGQALSVADTVHLLAGGMGIPIEVAFNGQRRPGDPSHLVGIPSLHLKTRVPAREGLRAFAADFSRL